MHLVFTVLRKTLVTVEEVAQDLGWDLKRWYYKDMEKDLK
jgi:hypothetical protein